MLTGEATTHSRVRLLLALAGQELKEPGHASCALPRIAGETGGDDILDPVRRTRLAHWDDMVARRPAANIHVAVGTAMSEPFEQRLPLLEGMVAGAVGPESRVTSSIAQDAMSELWVCGIPASLLHAV